MEKIPFLIDKKIVYVDCETKSRARLRITVTKDNQILIIKPKNVSKDLIISLFQSSVKRLLEFVNKKSNHVLYSIKDEYIFLNGKKLKIKFLTGFLKPKVKVENNSFYIMTTGGTTSECEKTLKDYLKLEMIKYASKRQRFFEKKMNVKPHKIKASYKFWTWGSNNLSISTINYSSRLMHYDDEIKDYLIVHELTHFLVQQHNRKFYEIVAKFLPNYRAVERKLNVKPQDLEQNKF